MSTGEWTPLSSREGGLERPEGSTSSGLGSVWELWFPW